MWKVVVSLLFTLSLQAAELGQWTSNLAEARTLADANNRPLLLLMWNEKGNDASIWLEEQIFTSESWKGMVAQQRFAMARYNCVPNSGSPEWAFWLAFKERSAESVNGFPTIGLYPPGTTNLFDEGVYTLCPPTNLVDQAERLVWLRENVTVDAVLERLEEIAGDYWQDDVEEKDPWDPKDDYPQGATVLTLQETQLAQRHVMSQTTGSADFKDWFRFSLNNGEKVRFSLSTTLEWYPITTQAVEVANWATNVFSRFEQRPDASWTFLSHDTNVFSLVETPAFTNGLPWVKETNVFVCSSLTLPVKQTNAIPESGVTLPSQGTTAPDPNVDNSILATQEIFFETNVVPSLSRWVVVSNGVETSFTTNGVTVESEKIGTGKKTTAYEVDSASDASVASLTVRRSDDMGTLLPFQFDDGSESAQLPLIPLQSENFSFTSTDSKYPYFLVMQRESTNVMMTATRIDRAEPMTNQVVQMVAYQKQDWAEEDLLVAGLTNRVWKRETVSGKVVTNFYETVSLVVTSRWEVLTITNFFEVTQERTGYVTNTPCQNASGEFAYTLGYQKWNPGEIVVAKPAVSIRENVKQVVIPVERKGGKSGSVRVAFRTESGTATGFSEGDLVDQDFDFRQMEGVLEWPDGGNRKTNIVVELIQDLTPRWEGDETFTVVLEPATNGVQAEIRTNVVTVTLKESKSKKSGKVQFAGYAYSENVEELQSLPSGTKPRIPRGTGDLFLAVQRVDGADGMAKVTCLDEELIWQNGEAGIQWIRCPDENDTFALVADRESQTRLGRPASVVALQVGGILPVVETRGLTQFGGVFKDPAGMWFWGSDGVIHCAEAAAGKIVTLQLTLQGPGRLTFTADPAYTTYPVEESPGEILLSSGEKTVKWIWKMEEEGAPSLSDLKWEATDPAADPSEGETVYTVAFGQDCVQTAATGVDVVYRGVSTLLNGFTDVAYVRGLPSGLRWDSATGMVAGIPSKAGVYSVAVGEDDVRLIWVKEPDWDAFVGTYSGWLLSSDDEPDQVGGVMTLTIAKGGRWTFQATSDGKTTRMSGNALGDYVESSIFITNAVLQRAFGDDAYAELDLEIQVDTREAVLGRFTLPVSEEADTIFDCSNLCYVYGKQRDEQEKIAPYKGYYTCSLPVVEILKPWDSDAQLFAPLGCGYLTFTVNANGSVRWNGLLADGNKVSGTSPLLFPTVGNPCFAFSALPSPYKKEGGGFSGVLEFEATERFDRFGYATNWVVTADTMSVYWWNNALTAMRNLTLGNEDVSELGFELRLNPAGSLYDTLFNLQTYYLEKTLAFTDWDAYDSLLSYEDLDAGWFIRNYYSNYDGPNGDSVYRLVTESYLAETYPDNDFGEEDEREAFLPFGTMMEVGEKSLAAPKRVVYPTNTRAFSEMVFNPTDESTEISQNLSNLRVSFARATGLLTGSFDLNYEYSSGETVRTKKRSVKLYGLYNPFYLDADEAMGCQGLGFYLLPGSDSYLDETGRTRKYSFSYSVPFQLTAGEKEEEEIE